MDDPVPHERRLPESTKTTIMVLVALVVVLIVAGIGIATVRDATETVALVLGIALGGHAGLGTVAFAVLVGYALAAIFRVLVRATAPRAAADVALEGE